MLLISGDFGVIGGRRLLENTTGFEKQPFYGGLELPA
jgi:hypothetical protein